MLYEGEVVTIDHAMSKSPIKLQPMQLQLQPLLESIIDFPAFASYLRQHKLDGVSCLNLFVLCPLLQRLAAVSPAKFLTEA